jgi:hypothetical protein
MRYWSHVRSFNILLFLHLILFKATNNLPRAILLDYSCLDNVERKVLPNSYHRVCLSYAEIANFIYATCKVPTQSTSKIFSVVKRAHQEGEAKTEKINAFRTLLKYPNVVPDLVRLLRAGGIWTLNCEAAYSALTKSRIEQVRIHAPASSLKRLPCLIT